ncbi:MAG: VWA domain-containing protein [Acidobacteriota bacterium]
MSIIKNLPVRRAALRAVALFTWALCASTLCASTLCVIFSARVASADSSAQLPAFGEVVDVKVINLEVAVTRQGKRVSGLQPKDFRLLVDGRDVPIEFFSEVSDGRVVRHSEGAAGGRGDVAPALPAGDRVGTRYLLFIDDEFSLPSRRNRVLAKLSDQLTLLSPEDQVAIVAFDGRQVEMLSSWTRSLSRLESALETAQERRAYGLQRRSERWQVSTWGRPGSRTPRGSSFSSTGFLGLGRALDGAAPSELRYADPGNHVARVVRAAASALRGFARPPGRKVMLLLAGDWPVPASWSSVDGLRRIEDRRQLFAPLVDTANRLGYTLYPIDVQGTLSFTAGNAEFGRRRRGLNRAFVTQQARELGRDALHHLADQTGGKAWFAGTANAALENVIADTRSYYWLGFTPRWQQDDAGYRVEVKVLTKGVKARSRRSFQDLSRQNEVSMWVESAHLFDAPLGDNAPLAVELGTPGQGGLGKVLLPVRLDIPLDRVTVLPEGGRYVTSLELRIAATDDDGNSADLPVVPVRIELAEPPSPGAKSQFETVLKLRRKSHRLLISLHDPASGGFLSRRLVFDP